MKARRLAFGKGLHIEAAGCVVNIREGLKDFKGRKLTSIEILPDDHYSGEPVWRLRGFKHNRVVKLKTVRR